MLKILDRLPAGILEAEPTELYRFLPGPTLIHLGGRRPEPLFVAVLLHGNEDTGWLAVRELLRNNNGQELPRALSIFFGNVEAARHRQRFLDHQPDYNRIWEDHSGNEKLPERAMMRQVVDEMRERQVFVSIDVHNNTGLNPHYTCVRKLEPRHLQLATLFSRTVVYFRTTPGVQTAPFSELCPSVTLECGQAGQRHGIEHTLEYLQACLHLSSIPAHPVAPQDIDLFRTVAVAKVPDDISIGFGNGDWDIDFIEDLDHLNFRELPVDTTLGWTRLGSTALLDVVDEYGRDVSQRYFKVSGGELRTVQSFMPSMLTVDVTAIRQDCLCYLMERYQDFAEQEAATSVGTTPG